MALSDFVLVQLSSTGPAVTVPGFGTPMILAADAPAGFTNRVRTYNKPADLVSDGFSATGPTYLMASALCNQNPRPPSFKVGRLANIPTQHLTITPAASNTTVYGMTLNGTHVSYTSDSTATAAEIVTGLNSAITALSISGLTNGGSTTLTLAMSAGAFLNVGVDDTTLLKVAQDHSDAGSAADLNAIALEDSDWYCLLNPFNSSATVAAIAAWAESNEKLYVAQTVDSECINHVASGATDIMATVKGSTYFYTTAWYSNATGDFLDASVAGLKLTSTPGSEVWGLTTLAGVAAGKYTATQRTNALAKNGNLYEANVGGLNITDPGKVASGEWIDVVRFKDWQVADMEAAVFTLLHNAAQTNSKVPFTDDGIQAVKGVMLASLKRGVQAGGLAQSPAPAVSAPLASAVTSQDKQNRTLTTMTFTATLAGAIQAVTPIQGVLTY